MVDEFLERILIVYCSLLNNLICVVGIHMHTHFVKLCKLNSIKVLLVVIIFEILSSM